MSPKERLREQVREIPDGSKLDEMAQEGWRPVAIEWERDVDYTVGEPGHLREEIPYGLGVSEDCLHLDENADEKRALFLMLHMIVEDAPLSEVAAGLNATGIRTRAGLEWTQADIFNMLPRLIEVAPQIFATDEWRHRAREVAARIEAML
jgi:hypothetical protein